MFLGLTVVALLPAHCLSLLALCYIIAHGYLLMLFAVECNKSGGKRVALPAAVLKL